MHDERSIIEARFRREFFTRIRPAVHGRAVPFSVTAYEVPGEPVPHAAIIGAPFTALAPGAAWGRPWGTTWFRFEATVPDDWPSDHLEAVIDLGFSGSGPGFQCEGLVYEHGEPRRGIPCDGRQIPRAGTPPFAADFPRFVSFSL